MERRGEEKRREKKERGEEKWWREGKRRESPLPKLCLVEKGKLKNRKNILFFSSSLFVFFCFVKESLLEGKI